MMLMRFLFFAAVGFTAITGFGQGTAPSKWSPSSSPGNVISFDYLCVAKASKDGKQVLLLIPSFVTETREVNYTVQVPYTEQIERQVEVNRKKETQTLNVTKVRDETRTRLVTVQVLNGSTQKNVPLERVRAWSLTGESVDLKALALKLVTPVHLYAVPATLDQVYSPIDLFYGSVMKSETLVLYITTPEPEDAPVATELAPAAPPAPVVDN